MCMYMRIYIWLVVKVLVPEFSHITPFPMGPASQVSCGAHHAFILAKSRIKYILCGRRSSEDTFAGFAAISAATAVELGTFRLHSSWMFLEPHVIQLRHITVPAQSRGEFGTL